MSHSPLIHDAGRTELIHSNPTVRELRIRSTQPAQPGFALGEPPFFQSMDEESDAEALGDWESEGGAPSPSLYMGDAEKP